MGTICIFFIHKEGHCLILQINGVLRWMQQLKGGKCNFPLNLNRVAVLYIYQIKKLEQGNLLDLVSFHSSTSIQSFILGDIVRYTLILHFPHIHLYCIFPILILGGANVHPVHNIFHILEHHVNGDEIFVCVCVCVFFFFDNLIVTTMDKKRFEV